VDFYARLGGNETANEDMTTSLLGPLRDTSSTWFRQNKQMIRFVVTAVAIVLCAIVLWWLSGGREVSPPTWNPDPAYQVSFVLTLASGLQEPGFAMVDLPRGVQRLQYYSGANTFIFNETGPSWSIVPRIDALACFIEKAGVPLQSVFPDGSRFKHKGTTAIMAGRAGKKNKVEVDEWVYDNNDPKSPLYYGAYRLYTRIGGQGRPIRFAFVGRNVILGTSHYDNYTIDYYDYQTLDDGVDDFWFQPPRGMPCSPHASPNGPVREHAEQLKRLFPEHADARENDYAVFRQAYGKVGPLDSPERENLFHATQRLIRAHNDQPGKSYELGLNHMADWTLAERRGLGLGEAPSQDDKPPSKCNVMHLHDILAQRAKDEPPATVSHQAHALPPGEQGTCGSCWAFAATGAIEGAVAKVTGKLVALSPQNLMDCSWSAPYYNGACGGGLDYMGYDWVIDHNGGRLATAASYPYINQDGFCHFDVKRNLLRGDAQADMEAPPLESCTHVTGLWNATNALYAKLNATLREEHMMAFNYMVHKQGPFSVSIDASAHDFYFYKSGVYDNTECKSGPEDLDHSVLALGFNLTAPKPYTVVRNNWGTQWGEGGYARIAQRDNICGVATAGVYVTVQAPTARPTAQPTANPTRHPQTTTPTARPVTSGSPSAHPTTTAEPTLHPNSPPSDKPTTVPTGVPSAKPTAQPTAQPTTTASPTDAKTGAPVPPPTSAPVPPPTGAPVPPPTGAPVPPTSPPTPPPTSPPTNPPTSPPTNPPTPPPTSPPTPPPTSPPTNPPTPPPTSPPTPPPTPPPTSPPTSPPTPPPTSPPTPPPTSPPTPPPTSPPTNPPA